MEVFRRCLIKSVQREQRETKYRTGRDPCSLPNKSVGKWNATSEGTSTFWGVCGCFSPRTAKGPTRGIHRYCIEILGLAVDVWKEDAETGRMALERHEFDDLLSHHHLYANQHQYESPAFHRRFIEEAEAFICGKQRQRSRIE